MDSTRYGSRLIAALAAALAAALLAIPLASAGQGSSCQANRTFEQASRAGALPEIYAALHGTAISNSRVLTCANRTSSS